MTSALHPIGDAMKAILIVLMFIVGLSAPTLSYAAQVGLLINQSRVAQGYVCTYRMADGSTATLRSNSSCPGAINR